LTKREKKKEVGDLRKHGLTSRAGVSSTTAFASGNTTVLRGIQGNKLWVGGGLP